MLIIDEPVPPYHEEVDEALDADHRLSKPEILVLAVLSRRPFGLRWARAVARTAGLSPTVARRALHRLEHTGYVEQVEVLVAEGAVRRVLVWRVRWQSTSWLAVAPTVRHVELPTGSVPSPPVPTGESSRVPARLGHLFWDQDLADLDTGRHGVLIANRVLRSEDPEGMTWIATNIESDDLRRAARSRGLEPRRARLAHVLADAND